LKSVDEKLDMVCAMQEYGAPVDEADDYDEDYHVENDNYDDDTYNTDGYETYDNQYGDYYDRDKYDDQYDDKGYEFNDFQEWVTNTMDNYHEDICARLEAGQGGQEFAHRQCYNCGNYGHIARNCISNEYTAGEAEQTMTVREMLGNKSGKPFQI
jgi:hypothetical protein